MMKSVEQKKKVVVVGTGGLAREFSEFFADQVEIVGYSSKDANDYIGYGLQGTYFTEEITPDRVGTNLAVVAIGLPEIKAKIYKDLTEKGFKFPNFIHSTSVIAKTASFYEGIVISPQCLISADVVLGSLSYINCHTAIGHDVVINRFVQINGGQIGGFTQIGEKSLIGSGSTIIENVKIGKNVTVGSGSTVFTDVMDNVTVLGNPAKVFSFKRVD